MSSLKAAKKLEVVSPKNFQFEQFNKAIEMASCFPSKRTGKTLWDISESLLKQESYWANHSLKSRDMYVLYGNNGQIYGVVHSKRDFMEDAIFIGINSDCGLQDISIYRERGYGVKKLMSSGDPFAFRQISEAVQHAFEMQISKIVVGDKENISKSYNL